MKVFYHEINTTPWMRTLLDSKFRKYTLAIKAINPRVPDAYPNHKIIGRMIIKGEYNDPWEHSLIERREAGAEEYFRTLLPEYQQRKGIVSVWEGPNEPALDTVQQCQNLVAFYRRLAQLMHDEGLLLAGFQASVAQPQVRAAVPGCPHWSILGEIYTFVDLRTRHSYWLPRGVSAPSVGPTDVWTALRHRLDEAELISLGFDTKNMPPLAITEGGIDGGVHGYGKGLGWKDLCSAAQYRAELSEWYGELDKDSYVLGGCLFTAGPTPDWEPFEITQELATWQANQAAGGIYWSTSGTTQPQPPPVIVEPEPPAESLPEHETATDIRTLVQKARWWMEELQRQTEAGNKEYAERIRLSLIKLLYRIEGVA